jgi:hypothetical protein
VVAVEIAGIVGATPGIVVVTAGVRTPAAGEDVFTVGFLQL